VQPQILVVTDPPHGSVDIPTVAEILGISEQDAGLKMAFGAPEVLMATDAEPARDMASALREAGVAVKVLDGHALDRLPWPTPALSFAFGKDGLVADTPDGVLSIGWDATVFAVYCRPPTDFSPPETPAAVQNLEAVTGQEAAEASQWGAVLDLYVERNGTMRRLLVSEALTDFSALALGGPTGDVVAATASECRDRFENLVLDDRFDRVRPRQRFKMGDESFDLDMRKLFSYGTLLLQQVLASVSDDLGSLTQYEYGSRLVHALRHSAES
jgi:hypothetical protein